MFRKDPSGRAERFIGNRHPTLPCCLLQEPQRPNFKGIGPRRPHPVTGALQRFYPEKYRNRKYVGSFTTLLLMVGAAVIEMAPQKKFDI